MSAQLDITVSSTLALRSVAVSAPLPAIDAGQTMQLTAVGTYNSGDVYDLTHGVTWASSAPANALVSNALEHAGEMTGLRAGTATITAHRNTVSSPNLSISVSSTASIPITIVGPIRNAYVAIGGRGRVIEPCDLMSLRTTGSCVMRVTPGTDVEFWGELRGHCWEHAARFECVGNAAQGSYGCYQFTFRDPNANCFIYDVRSPLTFVYEQWWAASIPACAPQPTTCPASKRCGLYGSADCGTCGGNQVCYDDWATGFCVASGCP